MKNNTFETFDTLGKFFDAKGSEIDFAKLPWNEHKAFHGVALKHLVTSKETHGQFSFHLVRINPNCAILNHVHELQLETHEVIKGSGYCINNGTRIEYKSGTVTILEMNTPHEVHAGAEGLYLFAKFFPALV